MATEKRMQVKRAGYGLLAQLYTRIKKHHTPHFTEDNLLTFGVSASRVDYLPDGIDPSFNPTFFEPASRQKLKALLAKSPEDSDFTNFDEPGTFSDPLSATYRLNSYFNGRLERPIDDLDCVPLVGKTCWAPKWPADVPYRPLNNFTGIQDWRVTRLFDSGTPAKPHMMVSMMNQINAQEDCLLQGELMAMIRVMHGRIPLNFFREHLIFPILIISYTGVQHARLVQGHIQDGKLHIQYTKLYDLRTEQTDIINLFLRYFLSVPVGDTKLAHIKG